MAEENTSAQPPDDTGVGVTVDGVAVRVPKGTLVLDAATAAGVHVPIYCAHPKMDPVAVCRMCLVYIEKMPKLQPACATYVSEGMAITTQMASVSKAREGVLEFLLLNHPLDCPVCDRGGECDLQDFAVRYGPQTSRFPITDKVHFAKALPLSDRIELDQERCILCWRCTRFYDEITGEKELVLQQRGVETLIAPFNDRPLASPFQGNLPEVCPVGALTHRQYRFAARPWDLQRTRGVCPECSYGCNINIDTRDHEIKRFASRDNPAVDDMWLCDRGRYSATRWNTIERIRRPSVRVDGGQPTDRSAPEACREAARQLQAVRDEAGSHAVGVLGSPSCTNEELWLLQRLAREVLATPHLDHQITPLEGLSPVEHELGIAEIEECSAVVVLGAEPEANAPVLTLRLRKAATKRGVRLYRVGADPSERELAESIRGERMVGLVADETNRACAARVAEALTAANTQVRRLTITRGVNGRGAKDLGVLPDRLPGYAPAPPGGLDGRSLLEAAAAGSIRALVLLAPSGLASGGDALLAQAVAAASAVVVIDSQPSAASRSATVLLPGHAYPEKLGSVTNVEGRVQRIRPSLPPSTSAPSETRVLTMIARELGAEWGPGDPMAVNRELLASVSAYRIAGNGGRAQWNAVAAS